MLANRFHRWKLTAIEFGVFQTIAHRYRVRLYGIILPLTIWHGFCRLVKILLGPRVSDILVYIIVVESSHLINGFKDVG